ncbi:MAG: ATP-dependent DNA ligase [Cyclobacteriaceae bacterium]
MKDFTELYTRLDQTNSTLAKVKALREYFDVASDRDKLLTIALLSHRRPKRPVNTTQMKEWAAEMAGLPFWLVDETHHVVGDLAETIAAILPEPSESTDKPLEYYISEVRRLRELGEQERRERLEAIWSELNRAERFVFNKIITGGFRVGVSRKLMTRALAEHTGIEESALAHRLMGNWRPEDTTYHELVLAPDPADDLSKPYPFYLAYALDNDVSSLGDPSEWAAEYKWDGIRGQVIVRGGELFVWSRGEELVTDKYPEYEVLVNDLPDGTVLDGEILPFSEGKPLPFQQLQTRIGRKRLTKSILKSAPVIFKAYDILEFEGNDVRHRPYAGRRELLSGFADQEHPVLHLSEQVQFDSWEQLAGIRENARSLQSEGIMLKHLESPYLAGRKKGDWWKWKVDPLTVDAVMIYAMRGHGRRANLYTDYTFAVWNEEGELIPFTKAYSGLTDKEIAEVDRFVKRNTLERFGPVRSVKPELVFELAFEGIQESSRHKSGIALRFPRISRWRHDKPPEEANTLEDLHTLLRQYKNEEL